MRVGLVDTVELAVRDAAGNWTGVRYPMDRALPTNSGPTMAFVLPATDAAPAEVRVRFTGLVHGATLESATLAPVRPDREPDHMLGMLAIALLLGMLAMPIVFDALFWRVLRDRFIVWHAAMTACFFALIAVRSGIVNEVIALPVPAWRILMIGTFGVAIAAGMTFTRHFIEDGKLGRRTERAMAWAVPWILSVSAIQALEPRWMLLGGLPLHAIALSPVLGLWFWATVGALLRGSRAAAFQLVGWIPLTAAFVIQLVTELVPGVHANQALGLFYFGMLSEALVTAVGVTMRFLALRDERDSARLEARALGTLVQRDPLTGLINRRGLDERFAQLQSEGFSTFALLDLDRFKQVNDLFGHAVGDDVLRAVAAALLGDARRDSVAVRMGGEEFLLLLRGDNARARAEAARREIARRVATEVTGLDRRVTASMGLVEIPDDGLAGTAFDDLYARADKLLYEAKEAGRDRTMHERLTLFAAVRTPTARVAA